MVNIITDEKYIKIDNVIFPKGLFLISLSGDYGVKIFTTGITGFNMELLINKTIIDGVLMNDQKTLLDTLVSKGFKSGGVTSGGVTTDLSIYAKTTDLSIYAKTTDLGVYAKTTDLGVYAKTTALSAYVKTTDYTTNNNTLNTSIGTKADKTYVDTEINTIKTTYAKTTDLSVYAKTTALSAYVKTTDYTTNNTTLNTSIGTKADKTYVDSKVTELKISIPKIYSTSVTTNESGDWSILIPDGTFPVDFVPKIFVTIVTISDNILINKITEITTNKFSGSVIDVTSGLPVDVVIDLNILLC